MGFLSKQNTKLKEVEREKRQREMQECINEVNSVYKKWGFQPREIIHLNPQTGEICAGTRISDIGKPSKIERPIIKPQ